MSMLQLHQQRQAARASTHITSSLVLPPYSEIVAPVSIRASSGIQPGRCPLIEPKITLMEDYSVLVGCTLVDTSLTPFLVLMTRYVCWVTSNGFLLWPWLADTGRWPCRWMPSERLCL